MLPGNAPFRVRWYHQSWAVIGGLLLVAGFFVLSWQSTLFLAVFQLVLVSCGLWLFFGAMDGTLTSPRPAVLQMRDWWRDRHLRRIGRGPSLQLPDHHVHEGFFVLMRPDGASATTRVGDDGFDVALARSLEAWGPLMATRDCGPEALDLARRARLVFVGVCDGPEARRLLPRLREDPALWAKTVLLVPPAPEPAPLRSLAVDLPLPADTARCGMMVATRLDDVALDAFPIVDESARSVIGTSLVRARPDLLHGPQAAPGARVVVDSAECPRTDEGHVVSALWLQPSEAHAGATRELLVDGQPVRVRVPGGITGDHQLRVPCQVQAASGEWRDLMLDIELV